MFVKPLMVIIHLLFLYSVIGKTRLGEVFVEPSGTQIVMKVESGTQVMRVGEQW